MHMRQNAPAVLDHCETLFRCAEPVSRSNFYFLSNDIIFTRFLLVVWKEVMAQYEVLKSGMAKLESELKNFSEEKSVDQFRPVMSVSFVPFSFSYVLLICIGIRTTEERLS